MRIYTHTLTHSHDCKLLWTEDRVYIFMKKPFTVMKDRMLSFVFLMVQKSTVHPPFKTGELMEKTYISITTYFFIHTRLFFPTGTQKYPLTSLHPPLFYHHDNCLVKQVRLRKYDLSSITQQAFMAKWGLEPGSLRSECSPLSQYTTLPVRKQG